MMRTSQASVLFATALLVGCTTVGSDYVEPEVETPVEWNEQYRGGLSDEELDPNTLAHWWTTLNDPILDSLIERAVTANLDLRTAEAQLNQARAQRGVAEGARFPTLGAGASATRSGSSAETGPGNTSELYSASFDAAWEIDIFGGQERAVEAAVADLQAAQEAQRDVLVSVLAEVALNYVELRLFQSRLTVTEQNLANQQATLEIVQAQFDAGAVGRLDLDNATANAAATRAEIPSLNQSLSQAKNRLAVLIGKPPGAIDGELNEQQPLPVPSARTAVGVPAETLRRRPDVRRAERQLAAETARVGVATAELYPKFSLNGSIGLESLSLSGLSSSDNQTFGIGPSVQWNLFDGGRTRRQIDVQSSVQEQALIQYEASILRALEEVENAITAFTQEQIRYRALQESAAAAASAADLADTLYQSGASSFMPVLDAQRTVFSAQDRLAVSEGAIVSNLIRLYKSLGGGWVPEQPES